MVCPDCGGARDVTARHYRRNQKLGKNPPCPHCLHPRSVQPKESHYRYWLSYAGVNLTNGVTAKEWIAENGIPEGLVPLIESASILPPLR